MLHMVFQNKGDVHSEKPLESNLLSNFTWWPSNIWKKSSHSHHLLLFCHSRPFCNS